MTRVLLTGAGGFVGSHVLEVLLADTDWEIVAVDSFRHNGSVDVTSKTVIFTRREGHGGSFQSVTHDLTVPFSPRQLDQIGKLDYIIHVASRCSVTESIDEPADFVRNNVDSTLTILELARAQWCWEGQDVKLFDHRLVHLSTDEVHGPAYNGPVVGIDGTAGQQYRPLPEDHRPSSPYAASKAAQEDLVHAWQRTYGIPSTVVTSANMFGERQSLLAFVPKVIGAVLHNLVLPIHTWHGQPGTRRYTYVRNTAQMVVDYLVNDHVGLAAPKPPTRVQRLSLPGQHRIDNLTLAQQIAGMIGRPLRYQLIDGPAVRPGYDPDYAPLGDDADWAELSFTEGLERTVKWFVDHPEWLK